MCKAVCPIKIYTFYALLIQHWVFCPISFFGCRLFQAHLILLSIVSGNSNFRTIIQILSITTSLLSLSFGFTTWRKVLEKDEGENWTLIDTVGDFVWNALTVIPRVITLALFATYQQYWFWGLIGGQIVLSMMIVPFVKPQDYFLHNCLIFLFHIMLQ